MLKKCVAFLAALTVLLACGCSFEIAGGVDFKQLVTDYESGLLRAGRYYELLTFNEKSAYVSIVNACEEFAEKARVPVLTTEELDNVTTAVSYDNPEFFFLSTSWQYTRDFHGSFVDIPYLYSMQEIETMNAALKNEIEKITGNSKANASDFEKELFIHDLIVSKCAYDNAAAEDYDSNPNAYTAYGALVEGKAVCEGYSRAAQLLLKSVGIYSYLIAGNGTLSDGGDVSHMWNVAEINGSFYHLDVTWDDPITQGDPDIIRHTYFNMTDSEIRLDHRYDFKTDCAVNTDNYFVRNSLYFNSFNAGDFVKKAGELLFVQTARGNDFIEIRFSDSDDYDNAKTELFENGLIYSCVTEANNRYGARIKAASVVYTSVDANRTIGIKIIRR